MNTQYVHDEDYPYSYVYLPISSAFHGGLSLSICLQGRSYVMAVLGISPTTTCAPQLANREYTLLLVSQTHRNKSQGKYCSFAPHLSKY